MCVCGVGVRACVRGGGGGETRVGGGGGGCVRAYAASVFVQ